MALNVFITAADLSSNHCFPLTKGQFGCFDDVLCHTVMKSYLNCRRELVEDFQLNNLSDHVYKLTSN